MQIRFIQMELKILQSISPYPKMSDTFILVKGGTELNDLYHIILDTKECKYKRIAWQETENLLFGVLEASSFNESILNQFEMYNWVDTIKDDFKTRNWLGIAKWKLAK